jgi:hypothetical protein
MPLDLKTNMGLQYKLNKLINPPLSMVEKILPIIIIFIVFCIVLGLMIQIDLSTSGLDWEKNKCIPKYMFISGFIKKEPGLGILASTSQNFKKCVTNFMNKNTVNEYVTPPTRINPLIATTS